MARLKILYLITRSELGGAQTHLVDLVLGFRGHVDQIVAAGATDSQRANREGTRDYLTEALRGAGVPFHAVPDLVQPIDAVRDTRALWQMVKIIRQTKPDLVHAHTSKAGILGRLAARITRTPAVFTAHTWSFAEGNSLAWKLVGLPSERIAANWTRRIINVSEANRRLAISNRVGSAPSLVTVHNGIADDPARANPAMNDQVTLTMVARFSRQKDHATLLRALAAIHQPFRALLVGDGPTLPEMKLEAARLGVTNRVEFCGARSDVVSILAQSQLAVLTTNAEGFPITILEAMRAGLPVIASDTGGTGESIADQKTGLLIPVRDVAAAGLAIRRLIEDPQLRVSMGAAGRRRFEEEFTLSTMLQKTFAVYEASLRADGVRKRSPNASAATLAGLIRTSGGQEHEPKAV